MSGCGTSPGHAWDLPRVKKVAVEERGIHFGENDASAAPTDRTPVSGT